MRIAYLDCSSGISGDMFLGALVDAGVSPRLLEETVTALELEAGLGIGPVMRAGIRATKVDVIVNGEKDMPRDVYHAHKHEHDRHHHSVERSKAKAHNAHHRGLKEIREIILRAKISETAQQRAIAAFEALGRAESRIHNTDPEKVHFHEVGAVDALVDIVCASVGAEELGVDQWICSPLNVGGGTVECAHGTFPVPAPATLELLKERGAPVYSSGVQKELVTPTGAAIAVTLAGHFGAFPAMIAEKIGYGAGFHDFPSQPNVLRISIGETTAAPATSIANERIMVLEANLDDLNPQVFGYVIERALEAGALDVFGIPVQMKKSRPGMLLTVLCRPEDADGLIRLIVAETSTLGVRVREEQRLALARRHVNVVTRWGEVRIKLASLNGAITNYAPEYEDCRRLAAEHGIPLKSVMQEAIRLYLERER